MAEVDPSNLRVNPPRPEKSVSEKADANDIHKVDAKVIVHKKSLARRFFDSFIATDAETVKDYVLEEVIFPGLKSLLVDALDDGAHMMFLGKRNGGSSHRKGYSSRYDVRSHGDMTSYNSMYGSDKRETRALPTHANLNDIVVGSREAVEDIYAEMQRLIDKYDQVSVAQLYDILDQPCEFTAYRYGWLTINDAGCRRVSDGYLLVLPPVVLLGN